MPRYIVKLNNKYLKWSIIIDAPVTQGMNLDQFREYYIKEYGKSSLDDLEKRLLRVEKKGCSSMLDTIEDLISVNRAGHKEKHLSKEEIIEKYCKE